MSSSMYPVVNDEGKVVGHVWRGSQSWIAGPLGSQIQNIPCDSIIGAAKTVKQLGRPQEHAFEVVE